MSPWRVGSTSETGPESSRGGREGGQNVRVSPRRHAAVQVDNYNLNVLGVADVACLRARSITAMVRRASPRSRGAAGNQLTRCQLIPPAPRIRGHDTRASRASRWSCRPGGADVFEPVTLLAGSAEPVTARYRWFAPDAVKVRSPAAYRRRPRRDTAAKASRRASSTTTA